jgi:hypothetical protein
MGQSIHPDIYAVVKILGRAGYKAAEVLTVCRLAGVSVSRSTVYRLLDEPLPKPKPVNE